MSCNIGLNKAITKILNDKPWFKYKQGDTFIEILESPATRINKKSSIGVANNLAIAINKLINKGDKKVGDVVYPAFNSNGWGIVEIRPKSNQLDLINATEIDEINRLQEEIFEEERLRELEEERLREEELTEEQLENREYFEQDEPYTSDFISEDEDNIPLTPIVSTKPIQEEIKDDKGQFKLFQESQGDLQKITKQKIDNLQSTIEYQLLNEKDEDLDKKVGQSYMFLSEKDAKRFTYSVEKNKEFPKEFKVTKKITTYKRDSKNPLKFNGYNEYLDFYYIKSNKNKKSNLYEIVNKETGEIIASKVRILSVSKDTKSEIAKKYGLEHTPTKIFSANRSIAFALYRQKPSKAKYIAQAKKYLYDAIKFLNPEETNLKINLEKIEELLSSFPDEMWDYINTTYSPEDSTNINASISLQNEIKFKLPKLGFLQEIEKITGVPLQGVSFKNYDRSGSLAKVFKYSKLDGGWGDTITIDNSMTTKELKASIRYYLSTKKVFKPTSEEENVRKYAEHRGIDYNELKELVFGDIDKALDNISYNNTGNSDTIELSKWRESIRNYDWQSAELFSKPYGNFQNTVKERIIAKFKDKNLSNGISHLEYFFNSGSFNWLNINFNNISGQYYETDMETEANVGVETKMGGIINPFEMKIYQKPKAGKNFLQEKEVFNRLAAILHEPFHALHALSYGTKEELELRKAFDNLYKTDFGKEMMNQVFGSGYNKGQQVSYDTLYKEFTAFTTQLMLYPKQWVKNTDLRSNDIYDFIEKIQTLQDKTYEEIVKTQQKIGTTEKTITEEEKIKLTFLEKLYNYLVKALNKIIPLSKKFTNLIADSKLIEKKVIEDVFGEIEETVTKTLKLPENVKKSKDEFLQAMDELQSAINTLMQIDSKLFSSENITNFFTSNKFNQEQGDDNSFQQFQQSLNNPNTNPILQGNQQEQAKKFAELQERLNNKEFLEGAKNTFESSEELQKWGTQEEYSSYIARVSLGIIKNPSSGEYNYESQVKGIVYHGADEKIENFTLDKKKNKEEKGLFFFGKRKSAQLWRDASFEEDNTQQGDLISSIINLKNPRLEDFENKSAWNMQNYLIANPSKLTKEGKSLLNTTFNKVDNNKAIVYANYLADAEKALSELLDTIARLHIYENYQSQNRLVQLSKQENPKTDLQNEIKEKLDKGESIESIYNSKIVEVENKIKEYEKLYLYFIDNNEHIAYIFAETLLKQKPEKEIIDLIDYYQKLLNVFKKGGIEYFESLIEKNYSIYGDVSKEIEDLLQSEKLYDYSNFYINQLRTQLKEIKENFFIGKLSKKGNPTDVNIFDLFTDSFIESFINEGQESITVQFLKDLSNETSINSKTQNLVRELERRLDILKNKKNGHYLMTVLNLKQYNEKVKDFPSNLKENQDGLIATNVDEMYVGRDTQYAVFEPEQIHILSSKADIEGFREFVNNKQDNKGQFKLFNVDAETFQTQANEKTVAAVKEALSKLGISIETSDNLLQQFEANGIAEFSEMLIKLQAGNENIALTEEFMHFVTMMIPESLLEDLMANIEDYKIYKKTLELYKKHTDYRNEDGSPNLKMIKLEAVGKLLAEFYIQKAENLSDKEINAAKTIWGRIKDWISSIFKSNVDVFKELIDNLNNGTLVLTEPRISRVDRLYSLDRYNTSSIVNKMLESSNTESVEKLIELAQSIKDEDLPFILSRARNIGVKREDFAYSRKILGDLNTEDLRESLTNALNYLMSSYNASQLLYNRVNDIINELSDKDKTLDKNETRYRVLELSNIESILQTYKNEFEETFVLFANEGNSELKTFLEKALGNANLGLKLIKNRLETETFTMLEDYFNNTKLSGFKKNIEKDILNLEKQLKTAKTDRVKEMIQASINTKRALYETPSISFNEIKKILKQGNTEQKSWERFLEGPLTNRNEVIQLITNLLQDINYEINRDFSEQNADLLKIFLDHGQKFSISVTSAKTNYDKFIQVRTKLTHFKDETTNKLVETQQLELIDELDNTSFENDVEIIKYLKNVKPGNVASEYEKYFGNKFGEDRPTAENQEEFLNTLITNIYEQNVEKEYTDEYYQIYDILNVTLSDNTTVKEIRKGIYDELDKAKKVLNSTIGSDLFNDALEDVRFLEKELLKLESFYYEDKTFKEGDDLIIAEAIRDFKAAKQKATEKGVPLFESFITYTAQLTWEEDKKQLDEEFKTAQLNLNQGVITQKQFNDIKTKRDQWYSINVVFKESPEFISKRNEKFEAIRIILEEYNNLDKNNETVIKLEETQTTLREIINLYKEYGTVNGSLADEATMLQVKQLEESIVSLKEQINGMKPKMSEEDYESLKLVLQELEDLQGEEVTEHWINKLESLTNQNFEEIDLGSLITHPEININITNVTKKYIDYLGESIKDIPKGFLIKYSEKNPNRITAVYAPTSLWKSVQPFNELYRKRPEPSYKWHSSKVNDYYVRESDIKGNRPLRQDNKHYRNPEFGKLTNLSDIEFLRKIKENYYNDQKTMPESKRLGNILPFMQASTTLKNKYRFKNIIDPRQWKKAFSKDGFLGKDFIENELGLGSMETSRTGTLNKYRIRYKYGSDTQDMLSHEKDLFKLLGSYKYETIRVNAFKQVMPQINKVRDIITEGLSTSDKNKNTKLRDDLDLLVEQKINSKNVKSDSKSLAVFRNIIQKIQGLTSKLFLFLLWQYTGSIKSFLSSTYAIFQGHTILKNFSEGSIRKAYRNATVRALEYSTNELSIVPSKYTAIMRRLNILPDYDERSLLDKNTNMLLKAANNAGYLISAGHRKYAESHATFVMLELYMDGLGKKLTDLYNYDDKTGKITLKDESFDETKATTDVRDMLQFVIGNHNSANNPIGKSTTLGLFLFMFGNHIANGVFARVGGERVLRSGVRIVPYWKTVSKMLKNSATVWNKDTRDSNMKLIKALMSTDAKTILAHKHLTAEERDGLFRFYKDFVLVNALGAIYYMVSKAMQDTGDDEPEDKLFWYSMLIFRKTYSEMNYFNPVEKVALPGRLLLDDDFGYKGNAFEKVFNYLLGKKAIETFTPSLFPGDYKGLRFLEEDIKTKDEYYSQWKNNLLLYNFNRYLRTKQMFDYEYGKQSLRGFEYFDKTIYQGSSDKKKSKKKSDLGLDLDLDLKL